MRVERTGRGFEIIEFEDECGEKCSMQQSSTIGNEPDAFDRPGSSMLWLGTNTTLSGRMHLTRAQVEDLIPHLQAWLATGSLELLGEGVKAT